MKGLKSKQIKRQFRARRTRAKLAGSAECPRLTVFRSNEHIYAQLINDAKGITVASASDLSLPKDGKKTKTELAKNVGLTLAKKAGSVKIDKAIFDKGPYKYHGIIKALADGAREGGLKF
ncbi:MAG: 50S ribosomal protein L18 [Parcubacteria group bacterium GW2011_GWA2_43_9b]|uniref:Large ribosomal subunit protein uL18 n=1 Tax=Candidatus Portnoybacteria bacterium RIFCSPLOWO2_02_FULL_39_11 TaxID=1802001 RepID=A0A1G2FN61_9BACT|nr:MAG: 50S ribosomal protein L18 [Parcubacteria group bacterium GW2011_GWA2_43_9b]OGZ39546.1 MAG: 50S ribosomal protein L18 [Candidatus Portnoybacteria bacterium RIFCSPLOWO2_02_FULL_39_11]